MITGKKNQQFVTTIVLLRLVEDGDTIKTYDFCASFSGSMASKESADKAGKKGKADDDDEQNDGKEMNEELKKLISIRIK